MSEVVCQNQGLWKKLNFVQEIFDLLLWVAGTSIFSYRLRTFSLSYILVRKYSTLASKPSPIVRDNLGDTIYSEEMVNG